MDMNGALQVGLVVVVLLQLIPAVEIIGRWFRREKNEITFRPPLEDRFAARLHEHADYISRAACATTHSHAAALEAKHEARAQSLQEQLVTAFRQMDEKAETRSAKLHARIDQLAQLASTVSARVDDHLEDHRNGRFDHAD